VVYQVTRLMCWLAARVPRRARLLVGGALCELVYWAWPAKRHVTIANMAQVLGTESSDARARALARRSWRNYGRYVSEFFYLPSASVKEVLDRFVDMTPAPGWIARMDAAAAGGHGVLVPTAHFGNWDAAGVVLGNHISFYVIAETFPDPRLNELVQRQRADLGMTVLPLEGSPRRILRVLQEGGAVATPVDRPLPPSEGVPVTFFGRRCYVPGGFAQLALKTGAAIVPGFVWNDEAYGPALYGFLAEPIFPQPTGDRTADVIRLTQQIYNRIEDEVRAHPAQWYMFRPFWQGEESIPGGEERESEAGAAEDRTQPRVTGAERTIRRSEGARDGSG
jgi:lauroyl/myristoyl acyltransferase